MAHLARVSNTRPLSRKGLARPMQPEDHDGHAAVRGAVTWHPAAMQRRHMATPCGATGQATGHATALAQSVAHMRPQRIRVSTRLDPDLHHRLKAHAEAAQRTQQSIVVKALEDYLADQAESPHRFGDRRTPAPR